MEWLIELISRIADKVYSLISPTRVLLEAAENGRYKVIAQLLRLPVWARPDVNARNHNGYTPLHWAAWNDSAAAIEQLLNLPVGERPDVNARSNYNETPLQLAARRGKTAVVAQLLNLPVGERPDVNARDNEEKSPLHRAASWGHAVVAQFLRLPVGERPDVNARDNDGNTPLHCATLNNHSDIVAQLLNLPVGERPGVNAGNNSGKTPLHWAAENGRAAVVAQFLNRPVGERPNVNARDNHDHTPLHGAAIYGHLGVIAQLLGLPVAERPNVNARSDGNMTPLHLAAKYGRTDIVTQFLHLPVGERPDVNAINDDGATAIQVAYEQGQDLIVVLLQRYGATLPARLRARGAPGAEDAINHAQSIHTASTHESVSKSATKLLRRYREKEIDTAKEALFTWVLSQTDTDIKTLAAKAAIGTYGNLNYTDPRSGVTFKQAFGLIWLGINDVNAVAGKSLTEEDLKARKKTLIEHLYRMQRGYNLNAKGEDMGGADNPICGSGGFSTLINTLAGGHQDVTFVYITSGTISLKAGAILTECIKAITPETKKEYLNDAKEEELPKEILAVIKQEIQQKLNDEFLSCKGLPPNYATLVEGFLENLQYHAEITKLAQELSEMQKSEALAKEAPRPRKRARR